MSRSSPFCPSTAELHVEQLAVADGLITITVVSWRPEVSCSACGTLTGRVHSHYPRTLADLLWQGTRARRRTRDALVAAQVALALVLLAGAGLLARGVQRLTALDLGFRGEHLTVAAVAYDRARYDTDAKTERLRQQVMERIRALPNVASATTL